MLIHLLVRCNTIVGKIQVNSIQNLRIRKKILLMPEDPRKLITKVWGGDDREIILEGDK